MSGDTYDAGLRSVAVPIDDAAGGVSAAAIERDLGLSTENRRT